MNPETQQWFTQTERGSTIVELLEKAWAALREVEPNVPAAVLTLVDAKSRRRTLGYFAHSLWKSPGPIRGAHEVAISPELLSSPEDLLATMLHEAAHAILHEAGKNGGMGSGGYYHTVDFRNQCIELGLDCQFRNTRYGWTDTQWPRNTVPVRFTAALQILEDPPLITDGYQPTRSVGRPLPRPGRTRLTCGCPNNRRVIYVPNSVVSVGGIICRFCRQEFQDEAP